MVRRQFSILALVLTVISCAAAMANDLGKGDCGTFQETAALESYSLEFGAPPLNLAERDVIQQAQYAVMCVTRYGTCPLYGPLPIGAPCVCYTPYGPIPGRAR